MAPRRRQKIYFRPLKLSFVLSRTKLCRISIFSWTHKLIFILSLLALPFCQKLSWLFLIRFKVALVSVISPILLPKVLRTTQDNTNCFDLFVWSPFVVNQSIMKNQPVCMKPKKKKKRKSILGCKAKKLNSDIKGTVVRRLYMEPSL